MDGEHDASAPSNISKTNQQKNGSFRIQQIALPITVVRRSLWIATKSDIQVCTCTEDLPRTGQDDDLDALVDIEHGEELFKVLDHLRCERIVFSRSIQRNDDHGRYCRGTSWVMGHRDLAGRRDLFVGGGQVYGTWVKNHDGLEVNSRKTMEIEGRTCYIQWSSAGASTSVRLWGKLGTPQHLVFCIV